MGRNYRKNIKKTIIRMIDVINDYSNIYYHYSLEFIHCSRLKDHTGLVFHCGGGDIDQSKEQLSVHLSLYEQFDQACINCGCKSIQDKRIDS